MQISQKSYLPSLSVPLEAKAALLSEEQAGSHDGPVDMEAQRRGNHPASPLCSEEPVVGEVGTCWTHADRGLTSLSQGRATVSSPETL